MPKKKKKNLLLRRFPEVEKQAVIDKTLQFLAVAVITNTDDGNF